MGTDDTKEGASERASEERGAYLEREGASFFFLSASSYLLWLLTMLHKVWYLELRRGVALDMSQAAYGDRVDDPPRRRITTKRNPHLRDLPATSRIQSSRYRYVRFNSIQLNSCFQLISNRFG